MPTVVVTIPTLAGGPLLKACLIALSRQSFSDFEVVVINNGKPLPDPAIRSAAFPVRVITPGSNVGFGAAVNLAIKATDSAFIATLNDDTEPDPDWLRSLVNAMDADKQIGMCASQIRLSAEAGLDSAGMLICLDGSSKQRGRLDPPDRFPESEEALLPSACAALYRRAMLNEIGLFDEDFFLYCEDTDLGLRGRWAGWNCRYAADATVLHHYSRTAGAFSHLKAEFVERNRLWVAIKNFPIPLLLAVPFVSLARYAQQLFALRNGRGAASEFIGKGASLANIAGILVRAHWETLTRIPELLRKRTRVRNSRRLSSAEFSRLLRRYQISIRDLANA